MSQTRFIARKGLESGGGVAFKVTAVGDFYSITEDDFLVDCQYNGSLYGVDLPTIDTISQNQIVVIRNSTGDPSTGHNVEVTYHSNLICTLKPGQTVTFQSNFAKDGWMLTSDYSFIQEDVAKGSTYRILNGNSATGPYSTVSGGKNNAAGDPQDVTREGSTISGGSDNKAYSDFSTVAGGRNNEAGFSDNGFLGYGNFAIISGGSDNLAAGAFSTIAGGGNNRIISKFYEYNTISGGTGNSTAGTHSTVSGGESNTAGVNHSTVSGGKSNTAGGISSTVSGGEGNTTSDTHANVSGGLGSTAGSPYSTVSGGQYNYSLGNSSVISGGSNNSIGTGLANFSVISGGLNNRVPASFSGDGYMVISGGLGNVAAANYSVISGGQGNYATGAHSVIGGGASNQIDLNSSYSTIGGGNSNKIYSASNSVIGGGDSNRITSNAQRSGILGGQFNSITGTDSFIGGGTGNTISQARGVIAGGIGNTVSATGGAILGGSSNTVSHSSSFIVGSGLSTKRDSTTHVDNLDVHSNLSYNENKAAPYASGEIVYFGTTVTGVGMTAGFVYEYGATGAWGIARADASANANGLLAIALGSTPSSGMLLRGFARYTAVSSYTAMGTTGGPVYLSKTANQFTQTAPGASGDIVRIIGYCINPTLDLLYFAPDTTWITLTT